MPLPKWERLSEALQRVTGTGVTEKKAKRDICEAIADRKIRLRLYFTWRPTSETFPTRRGQPTSKVHCLTNEEIPSVLRPGDFDWRRSRIWKSGVWQNVRGPFGSLFANWRVIETAYYRQADSIPDRPGGGHSLAYQHRVELRSADVTKALKIRLAEQHARDVLERLAQLLPELGPKTRAIAEIIIELGPKQVLRLPTAKDRNKVIVDQLAKKGHKIPENPERSIQRVLARLRQ
jgi:hypothetical protein